MSLTDYQKMIICNVSIDPNNRGLSPCVYVYVKGARSSQYFYYVDKSQLNTE